MLSLSSRKRIICTRSVLSCKGEFDKFRQQVEELKMQLQGQSLSYKLIQDDDKKCRFFTGLPLTVFEDIWSFEKICSSCNDKRFSFIWGSILSYPYSSSAWFVFWAFGLSNWYGRVYNQRIFLALDWPDILQAGLYASMAISRICGCYTTSSI